MPTLAIMDVVVAERPVSVEEFLAIPEGDEHYELVDGQVVRMSSPRRLHQRAAFRLALALNGACPAGIEVLPGIDWVLWRSPRGTVRWPDVIVVPFELADAPRLTAPPILAVEVLSPDSVERDVVAKRREYARAGLEHYWVVNPWRPEVVAYHLVDGELVEVQRLVGDTAGTIERPFPVALCAATLVS